MSGGNRPSPAWMKRCTKGKGWAAIRSLARLAWVVRRWSPRVVSTSGSVGCDAAPQVASAADRFGDPRVDQAAPGLRRGRRRTCGDTGRREWPRPRTAMESGPSGLWSPTTRCGSLSASALGGSGAPASQRHGNPRRVGPTGGCAVLASANARLLRPPNCRCHHRESGCVSCSAVVWVLGFGLVQWLADAGARHLPHAAAKGRSRPLAVGDSDFGPGIRGRRAEVGPVRPALRVGRRLRCPRLSGAEPLWRHRLRTRFASSPATQAQGRIGRAAVSTPTRATDSLTEQCPEQDQPSRGNAAGGSESGNGPR
jgi:hypothetical protein